jgi:IMP dehydrogenase
MAEVLFGPGHHADGTSNLVGMLRRSMATSGYSDLKEFQRVDVVVAPQR